MCESKLSRALRPKLRYAVNTRGIELDRIVSDTRTIVEIRFAANILHKKTSKIFRSFSKIVFPVCENSRDVCVKIVSSFLSLRENISAICSFIPIDNFWNNIVKIAEYEALIRIVISHCYNLDYNSFALFLYLYVRLHDD